jgi:hypothetical protein
MAINNGIKIINIEYKFQKMYKNSQLVSILNHQILNAFVNHYLIIIN